MPQPCSCDARNPSKPKRCTSRNIAPPFDVSKESSALMKNAVVGHYPSQCEDASVLTGATGEAALVTLGTLPTRYVKNADHEIYPWRGGSIAPLRDCVGSDLHFESMQITLAMPRHCNCHILYREQFIAGGCPA